MLPWMLRAGFRDLGGVGWMRGTLLAIFAGPIFVLLGTSGFLFAPLSHGAVIQPSTATLVTMLLGWFVLKEQVSLIRAIGTILLISGLAIVASRSVGGAVDHPLAWIGDSLFFLGGLFWVGFTLCLRRWSVNAVAATASVSILSAAAVVPLFVLLQDFGRLAVLPTQDLLAQLCAQGLGAGVLALIAYAKAVQLLGAARAALFPAVVPVSTLLVGIPVTGEIPALPEAIGALLASLGLAVALGVLDPILSSRKQKS
ncbi:EamA-like transporter family protein [Shimia aestuarii]|uniref:EamA-like transporter family protein n=2 Tax=Shimia aestuarii TaxID=254406 RepID=A0A1I4MP66_9RHOB|nr:EamA-like transporter family protein [Shimia aestuarii]